MSNGGPALRNEVGLNHQRPTVRACDRQAVQVGRRDRTLHALVGEPGRGVGAWDEVELGHLASDVIDPCARRRNPRDFNIDRIRQEQEPGRLRWNDFNCIGLAPSARDVNIPGNTWIVRFISDTSAVAIGRVSM